MGLKAPEVAIEFKNVSERFEWVVNLLMLLCSFFLFTWLLIELRADIWLVFSRFSCEFKLFMGDKDGQELDDEEEDNEEEEYVDELTDDDDDCNWL